MRVCPKCGQQAADDVTACPTDGTPLVAAPAKEPEPSGFIDTMIGAVLAGRYKIVRRIGEGGMGVVYEAEHVALGKHVALKVLREDFTRKSDLIERFKQEARSASIIGHENIIDVSDFGETEQGGIFFAMELLRGEDLADVLQREGRLALPRAVHVMGQMCRALHAAHQKGIIHRDLKPENVFLVQKDERPDVVKVLDFGIAKMTTVDSEGRRLTQSGVIFGTPEYMAPEQARGQTLDHRVDVYAAGVMLYEMLSGRVPFTGDSFVAILTQHLFSEARPLSVVAPDVHVPRSVESVVMKAMAKDRDERYATMLEMQEDLQRAFAGESVEARSSTLPITGQRLALSPRDSRAPSVSQPPAAVGAPTRPGSRRGWWIALVLLLVLGGGAAATIVLWQGGWLGGEAPARPPEPFDAGWIARVEAVGAAHPLPDATAPGTAEAGSETAETAGAETGGGQPDTTAETGPDAGPDAGEGEAVAEETKTEPDGGDEPGADAGAGSSAETVTVEVRTEPTGARLYDSRGRLLCPRTPCPVESRAGATLSLHAEKDPGWTGDDRFPIRVETRRVSMTLRRPVTPVRDGGTAPSRDADPFHLRQPDGLSHP
ncbi:MAG: protein kinase [Deltaproteobacteria bacterium]|nr:protein kinase [Deltaproteobacteria bacterium]